MMTDGDFPKALGFLQSYRSGMTDYSQSGDVIPDLRLQNKYAQEAGGPLVEQDLISGTPSFEIERPGYGPAIPQGMFRSEMERLYPGYNERRQNAVPNLLKRFGLASDLQAANQGPSTPVKYDEGMGGFVPNQGAGRPANIRYKGNVFGA